LGLSKTDLKFFFVVAILVSANIAAYIPISRPGSAGALTTADFPAIISDWTSQEVSYDKLILDTLKPDAAIYRQYKEGGRTAVTLFIACYNSAEKSDLSHSPIVCFKGQGWDILSSSQKNIPVDSADRASIRVNRLEQRYADVRMVSYYWYQSSRHVFSNRGIQKISLLIHELMGQNGNNAFVRLTVQGPVEKSLENEEKDMDQFIKALFPELQNFLS
jgi:EpsI family protein